MTEASCDLRSPASPGQKVCGKCVVHLNGPIKLRCLRIFMRGYAKVHWMESRSAGNRLGALNTEHYNAELEYFFKRQVLFGAENGILEVVLQKGHHEFPFSFVLPQGGLSTSFEGKYGSIRYWLKAEMDKLWTFNHKVKRAFTIISPIDINKPEYLVPVQNNEEKTLCCWCCTSGIISLYAKTDRRGYCPGESIAITANFENLSKRTVVPLATLHQTQTFMAAGKSRLRRTKFTTVVGLSISPSRTANWDAQMLKIPAVSPSIVNCSPLIKVDYSVRITLHVPGGYNLFVDLPIVIGTVPHRNRSMYAMMNQNHLAMTNLQSSIYMTQAPPYAEHDTATMPNEPPPSYAECVEGSIDITEDDEVLVGDTRFTPMYTYVHDYMYTPPPAYTEVDPNPVPQFTCLSEGTECEPCCSSSPFGVPVQ